MMHKMKSVLGIILSAMLAAGCARTEIMPETPDTGDGEQEQPEVPSPAGVPRLHILAQTDFSTGSTESKYAYMLMIASMQGLMNANDKDAIYLRTTNDLDWSPELGRYADEVVKWGKDW